MIGTSLEHYQITGQLGVGGMGEVYRARDSRLRRDVAIKVLPELSHQDPERLARFEREARLLASLSHPHIAAIYELGHHAGKRFLVLELIEGETLEERLRRGSGSAKAADGRRLPIRDALEVCKQIAEALEAAHAKKIIHRDLKPSNIKLTAGDQVKVLDFGLAKALDQTADPEVTTKIVATVAGSVMGSPAYMSPEQVSGEAVNEQSDIWSFGCILYECLTGERLFGGRTITECFSAVLQKEPDWARLPKGTPSNVEQLLRNCLERDARRRLRHIDDAVVDLEQALGGLGVGQIAKRRPISRIVTLGAVAIAGVLLLAAAIWQFSTRLDETGKRAFRPQGEPSGPAKGAEEIESIAVLPFVNMSPDKADEYWCDGLTEELLNALSKIKGLRVPARTSAFMFKEKKEDVRKIGELLNVGHVLEGSVRKAGKTLRITVQLINVADGFRRWSDTYDRELKMEDILQIQSDIAQRVASALSVQLGVEDRLRLAKKPTESLAAFTLYRLGRHEWNKFTEEGFAKSIEFYARAINQDSNYALAYSGLADSYAILGMDYRPPKELLLEVKHNAQQAVALDDTLSESHVSLGMCLLLYEWKWDAAGRELSRAVELNPNYADARHYFGHYFEIMGKTNEALAQWQKAWELDPLSPVINNEWGWSCYFAGQYDQAIQHGREALEFDANFLWAYLFIAQSLEQQGRNGEALGVLKEASKKPEGESAFIVAELAWVQAALGRKDEAEKQLELLLERRKHRYVNCYYVALIHWGLGDTTQTLNWLETAYEERSGYLPWLKVEPKFKNLRTEPRFTALLKRIGLEQ